MSLCNTNWKDVFSGQTHQPDVDFIVNGRDGERVFPAHRYLLAIVSPVLKEQFYGENRGNLEETSGRIKIHLDSSYIAVEAFFKYVFENCIGNLAFNDLFELLRLSERFQMEKMSLAVKEFIAKFIVDNKVETVEEICVIKKVEKDFKDKRIIMKDQLGHMAEENNALKHTVQQYQKELKEKNEKLEQALIRTTSFEQVEAKLKLDFNVLQNDRNILTEDNKMFAEENKMLTEENKMLTEENKKLKDDIESMSIEEENKNKHNMANLQKEQDILVEEKEVLVEEIKALKSQVTDFALEKERMDDFCDSLSLSNDIIMKENVEMKDKVKQNAAMKDKMKQIAEKAKLKGVKKTKKNISGVLEEISKMSIGVAESIHDNTDDGEKTTEVSTLIQKSFAVGDSFIAQWIQDGLWSRGVINSVYPNGKIVVKFINSQKWKELPIDKGVLKTSNNQTQNVGDELQPGCSISKSEQMEVKPETNFEVKENHSGWSYTVGSRTLISIPTGEDDQEMEGRANILELKNKSLELENKLLKERVSTTRETFKKALINSNVRHKTNTDEKKLLEEEMEAMKIAYGAQINFLKKEIGSLKGRCSKDESSNNPAEMPLKELEIKLSHSINPAVASPNQPLNEISPKVNSHQQNMINEELTDFRETLASKRQDLELIQNVEGKNEQLNMVKDELKKINEELTDVKETLACKKQELEKLKTDFDDKNEQYFRFKKVLQSKNEQLETIKSNVAVLKEVEKNLTLAERNLLATIKSLNEDKKKLEKENEQLKSSTPICLSPLAKKRRLSCDVSDEGDKSEDLRMSLDQRKIRRVLTNNVESGNPDDELDNFDIIQIETGSEKADDLEDFEYVDSASGRSANNSPRSAPTHLEKTQSAKSHNLSPATHHTPSLRTQSSRSPERGGRFRARRSTRSPSDKNRRSRTRSPRNRGSSTTCKSSPRRQSSSSNKRPYCPERGRSSPRKHAHEVKQERKDFDKIQVTVQREGIHSPPDKRDSNVKERCSIGSTGQGKPAQQKNSPTKWARIRKRAGREGFRKNAEKREKKSNDERDKLITLDGIRYQVKDCDKGKVFQRLGEKTNS